MLSHKIQSSHLDVLVSTTTHFLSVDSTVPFFSVIFQHSLTVNPTAKLPPDRGNDENADDADEELALGIIWSL